MHAHKSTKPIAPTMQVVDERTRVRRSDALVPTCGKPAEKSNAFTMFVRKRARCTDRALSRKEKEAAELSERTQRSISAASSTERPTLHKDTRHSSRAMAGMLEGGWRRTSVLFDRDSEEGESVEESSERRWRT